MRGLDHVDWSFTFIEDDGRESCDGISVEVDF
jgi:hypothetical protein